MVDDMNGPYGQAFQLNVIESLWNTKTVEDEKFLENRKQEMKMLEEHMKLLPICEQYLILLHFFIPKINFTDFTLSNSQTNRRTEKAIGTKPGQAP